MQIIEQKIIDIVQGTMKTLGFDLVKVTLKGTDRKVLEVLMDRLDGNNVSIADCRSASRSISALLDVADIIKDKYFLEVSSAGVERPLVRLTDYVRFIGKEANIKLNTMLDGKTRYKGKIIKADDNKVYLNVNDQEIVIAFYTIKKATLVLTDEMFRNLMNKNRIF